MFKVKLDGKYLYHPWDKSLTLTEAKMTQEPNKNGSFDFTMPPDNPLYGSVLRRKSMVEVVRFNPSGEEKVVYRGCCMEDTGGTDLYQEVKTDGDMVFLNDTIVRPYGLNDSTTRTPAEQFAWLIAAHNAQTDDFKRFTVRTVNVAGEAKRFIQEGYVTTRTEIDALVSEYGGYVQTETVGDVHYIDYLTEFGTASQEMRQGKNIIDITKHVKTDTLATRIIPLGTSTETPTTIVNAVTESGEYHGVDYIQDDEAVAEFGIIERIVEFSDKEYSPTQLLAAGLAYLETVKGATQTIELTAVDLADAGYDAEAIEPGYMVSCAAPSYSINLQMQVSKKVTDLLDPGNVAVTVGAVRQTFTQAQLKETDSLRSYTKKAVTAAANAETAAGNAASAADSAKTAADNAAKEVENCIKKGSTIDASQISGLADLVEEEVDAVDISGKTITFEENSSYEIASGESAATLFGKIKKLISTIVAQAPNFLTAGRAPYADALYTMRYIDGVGFKGTANISHYGTCGTTGSTAAKTVSITNFSLVTGARVMVRFTYANTATSPTLNVSGTGAKYIRYRNAAVPTGYITAGALLGLVYSGTYWYIANDLTQKQVDDLTTKVGEFTAFDAEDVTDSFNWGSCEDYKAYRVGKVVFFRATCTTKSASTMTFATIADASLYPIALTCLECEVVASADATKRPACFAYTDGGIKLTTYSSYSSSTAAATSGNVVVSGHWIIE